MFLKFIFITLFLVLYIQLPDFCFALKSFIRFILNLFISFKTHMLITTTNQYKKIISYTSIHNEWFFNSNFSECCLLYHISITTPTNSFNISWKHYDIFLSLIFVGDDLITLNLKYFLLLFKLRLAFKRKTLQFHSSLIF